MRGGRAHRPPHIRSRTCCLRSTSLTVAVTGEGRATHLGDSDLSATVTIVLATGVGTSTDTTITASGDEHEDNLFLTTVTSETLRLLRELSSLVAHTPSQVVLGNLGVLRI